MKLLKGKTIISALLFNHLNLINQTKPHFNQGVKPTRILIYFPFHFHLRIWSWGAESIIVNSSAKLSKCQTAAILFTTILISEFPG